MSVNTVVNLQASWQQKEKNAGYGAENRPKLITGVKIVDFEVVPRNVIEVYTPKSSQSRTTDKHVDNLRKLESHIKSQGIKMPIVCVVHQVEPKKRLLESGHHRLEVVKTICEEQGGFVKSLGGMHKWCDEIPSYIVEFDENVSKLRFRALENAHDPAEPHSEPDGIKYLNDMAHENYFKGDSDKQKKKKAQDLLSEGYPHFAQSTRTKMVNRWLKGGKPASMRTYTAPSCSKYFDENKQFTITDTERGNVRHSPTARKIEHVIQHGAVWQGIGSIHGKLCNYYWKQIEDGKAVSEVKKEIAKTNIIIGVHVPAKSANTPTNLEDARKTVVREVSKVNLTNGFSLPALIREIKFAPQNLTSGCEENSAIIMVWNAAKKEFQKK